MMEPQWCDVDCIEVDGIEKAQKSLCIDESLWEAFSVLIA